MPGAFHEDRARLTGADGGIVIEEARRLGFATTVAPTRGFGPLRENAGVLRDWLAEPLAGPVILVSLSKGTAEITYDTRPGQRQQEDGKLALSHKAHCRKFGEDG